MTLFYTQLLCSLFLQIICFSKNKYSYWKIEPNLPFPRSDMTATSVDNLIYLIGGCDEHQVYNSEYDFYYCPSVTNRCNIFDSSTETFSTCTSAPRPRYRHAAAEVNNKIYLIGGRNVNDSIINFIDIYDISGDTWSSIEINHVPLASDLSVFVDDALIYVVGGYNPNYGTLGCVKTFHTTINNFIDSSIACMSETRGDFGTVILDDYAYAIGGFSNDTSFCRASPTVERYDFTTNTWSFVSNLQNHGRGDKAISVLDGLIFVFGGEHNNNCSETAVPLNDVQIYDPTKDEWKTITDIPEERFRFAAATSNDAIYIFGGQSYFNSSCNCFQIADDVLRYKYKNSGKSNNTSTTVIVLSVVFSIIGFVVILAIIWWAYNQCKQSRVTFQTKN